jgi:predicted NAD/FAD-binding protein
MRIAVIGAGVSGMVAARLLSSQHDVTLFAADQHAGGHAHTVDVSLFGQSYQVDVGFMVFNRRTYPNFCRLLELLDVASQPSDMSFSVRCEKSGLEYQGGSLNGLFAQRRNLLRPSFLRMLRDIVRFNRFGTAAAGELRDGRTVGEFLCQCGVGPQFVEHYLVPMAAAIWSSRPQAILDFPAQFLIGFFANHGLLQVRDRPQWRTIVGGSQRYVERLIGPLGDRVRRNTPIEHVSRTADHVVVRPLGGSLEVFDEVVFATHADQTLRILKDVTDTEREVLGAFPYHSNQAVLHTDASLLPRRRRAWASWNYRLDRRQCSTATVTYDLTRLQRAAAPRPILLTLNNTTRIDPQKVLRTFIFHHPAYSAAAVGAQRRWREISGCARVHFCGAYWGYGFHEDGVKSALTVARDFGIGLEACTAHCTKARLPIAAASR